MSEVELRPSCLLRMSAKLRKVFPRTSSRRMFVMLMGLLAWSTVVLPIFYLFGHEQNLRTSHFTLGDDGAADRIDVSVSVLRIDAIERMADVHVQIDPRGTYHNANHSLAEPVLAYFRVRSVMLAENQPIDAVMLRVPFLQGSVRDYPFDRFVAFLPFLFQAQGAPVPFFAKFSASIPTMRVTFGPVEGSDLVERDYLPPDAWLVKLQVTRTPTVAMFCCVLTMIMWALALSVGGLAYDVLVFKRSIPPPLLSIGVAMLFALPSVRNAQPGIPSFGCAADVLGYFWTLLIIAFASCSMIYCYVLRWNIVLLD